MKRSAIWVLGFLAACGGANGPAGTASIAGESAGAEAPTASVASRTLEQSVENPGRDPEHRARDVYRHPQQTLSFFGLEPEMRVLELWPGRGYYTEVLAPVLTERGSLTVALTDAEAEGYRGQLARDLAVWFRDNPQRFGKVETVVLAAPDKIDLGAPGSYDMIVTFRNTHNWINDGVEQQVYAAVFDALTPGGVLGVVQHRAPEGADAKASAQKGYVPEAHVIALAEQAGFVLEDKSEVNANPADTKDYPDGVWTLPPVLRGPQDEHERMKQIGESDRMTLRFRKPASP